MKATLPNRLPSRRKNAIQPVARSSQKLQRTKKKQASTTGNPSNERRDRGRRVLGTSTNKQAPTNTNDGSTQDDDVTRLIQTMCSRIVLRDDSLLDGHPSGYQRSTLDTASIALPSCDKQQTLNEQDENQDPKAIQREVDQIERRRRSIHLARERENAQSRLNDIARMTQNEVTARILSLRQEGRARLESFGRAKREIEDYIEILRLSCQELSARQAEYESSLREAEGEIASEAQKFLDLETARVATELQRKLDSVDGGVL